MVTTFDASMLPEGDMKEMLEKIQREHEAQFQLALAAALYDSKLHTSFPRWFDKTWQIAEASGAKYNPFLGSMFAYFTSEIVKRALATMRPDERASGVVLVTETLHAMIEQIRAAAAMDIDIKSKSNPKPDPNTDPKHDNDEPGEATKRGIGKETLQ